MRCLYCGKELPLFKRLAKGEFCSDDHRQRYQQEYSQLALNRLLQAKPSEEPQKRDLTPPQPPQAAAPASKSGIGSILAKVSKPLAETKAPSPTVARTSAPPSSALLSPPPQPKPTLPAKLTPTLKIDPTPKRPEAARLGETPKLSLTPKQARPPMPAARLERNGALKPTEPVVAIAGAQRAAESVPAPRSEVSASAFAETETPVAKFVVVPKPEAATSPSALVKDIPTAESTPAPGLGLATLAAALSENPPPTETPVAESVVLPKPDAATSPTTLVNTLPSAEPAPLPESQVATLAAALAEIPRPAEPIRMPEPDVAAPAEIAGIVAAVPPAAGDKTAARAISEIAPVPAVQVEIPSSGITPALARLENADSLSGGAVLRVPAAPWRARAVRLEIRDFARMEPVFENGPGIAGPTLESAMDPATLPFPPATFPPEASVWAGPPQEFRVVPEAIEEIANLDLPTTGLEASTAQFHSAAEPKTTPAEEVAIAPPVEAPLTDFAPPILPTPDLQTTDSPTTDLPTTDFPAMAPQTWGATTSFAAEPDQPPSEAPPSYAPSIAPLPEAPTTDFAATDFTTTDFPPKDFPATDFPAMDLPTAGLLKTSGIPLNFAAAPKTLPSEAASITPLVEAAARDLPTIDLPTLDLPTLGFQTSDFQTPDLPTLDSETSGSPVGLVQQDEPSQFDVTSTQQVATEPRVEPNVEPAMDMDSTPAPLAPLPDPEPATDAMPIVLESIPGGKAKPVQVFTSTLRTEVAVDIPRQDPLPLRALMLVERVSAPPITEPAEPISSELVAGAEPETAAPPALLAKNASGTRSVAPAPVRKVIAKNPAPAPVRTGGPLRLVAKANPEPAPAAAPLVAGVTPSIELVREQVEVNRQQAEVNRQQAEVNRQQAERIRERGKASPRTADSPAPSSSHLSPSAPLGLSVPVSAPAPVTATGVGLTPKAGLPLSAPGGLPSTSRTSAPSATPENDLGLPTFDLTAVKKEIPMWGKIAAIAVCLLLVGGGTWFFLHDRSKMPEVVAVSSLSGGTGPDWFENFSPDAKNPRTISVLRSSQGLFDYTVEFSASIDVKALGWVFRAKDPANFYVGRIEQEKTMGGPAAAFVYFPVINGVRQERKRSPVALPAAPGTIYKIRFEAYGDRFTAWIQDRKVDEWTDGRLMAGGAGLYSESGERALLQDGFRVIARTAAK